MARIGSTFRCGHEGSADICEISAQRSRRKDSPAARDSASQRDVSGEEAPDFLDEHVVAEVPSMSARSRTHEYEAIHARRSCLSRVSEGVDVCENETSVGMRDFDCGRGAPNAVMTIEA